MMPDREKVKKGIWQCWLPMSSEEYETQCHDCPYYQPGITLEECMTELRTDALELLKEQEAKPLRCKECSYHRDDGWCNEHGKEVKESDYCSFGAWEGR